jgi:hypothetical protein
MALLALHRGKSCGAGFTPAILAPLRAFALTLTFSLTLTAFAVAPNFTAIAPAGAQRGTTVEVTLRGDRLADAQEIFFYTPGLTLEKIVSAKDKEVKALVAVAPDCRLGEHALRLRTAGGVSALRLFYVGPFPTLEEKEPNNESAKAQPVALNTTVHGQIGNEDIDTFSVEAKKDRRLSVEIEGARLGRTMFDPVITVQDATGRTVASSDDTPLLGHDGFVSFLAPADGKYLIQVRDMTYAGNGHFYRLHLGDFPRPATALPLGGRAGETLAATFIGDPTGDFSQSVTLPAEKSARTGVTVSRDGLAPSPAWFRAVAFPNADPVTPGATLADAPLVATPLPFAFNGVLATKGDAAFFRFTAKKDQNLDFQVFARRLGSPLDSVLTVLDAKGKSLGNNDDAAGHPDSAARVRIPADGIYVVKVADQLARGGPRFTYRVEIDEVQPALVLSIPDTARYDNETRKSLVVPRGNRFAVLMNINRETFNGDLALQFPNLPAGITALAATVPGSLSAVPVVFTATADAALAGNLLTPAAAPTDPAVAKGKPVASRFRHTVDWVRIQNDTVYTKSEVGQIAAAVVEEVPFSVRIVEPKVPIVQGGEQTLSIIADRADGFDEPITVKMLWNAPGLSSLPDVVIPKGAHSIDYKINATPKAEVRKWRTAVVANATVQGGAAYVSSQLATLEIAEPYLAGKIALTKVARGQTVKMLCTFEQKVPFEGIAIARLVGLPPHVTAESVELTKDSKEAVFSIVTTDKSPVGTHKNIFCSVVITRECEPIAHVIASGSMLRIDPAKSGTLADAKK